MTLMILHAGEQRRHIKKAFELNGKKRGWDDLREYH